MGKKKSSKSKREKSKTVEEHGTQSSSPTDHDNDDGIIRDSRFQMAQTHPQFQKLHTKRNDFPGGRSVSGGGGNLLLPKKGHRGGDGKEETKEVDDRFSAVLTDSRFAMGGDVGIAEGGMDKRGKKHKKKKKKSRTENDPGDEHREEEQEEKREEEDHDNGSNTETDEEEDTNDDEADEDPESRIAFLKALSRGEIEMSSSSSEDETSDDDDDHSSDDDASASSEDSVYGAAGILDPSTKDETLLVGNSVDDAHTVAITYDKSRFMAVCNMDWTSVRAVDLLAVASSFAPPGSVACSKVFPSDFGLERMEKDRMMGPQEIWKKRKDANEEEVDEDDTQSDGGDEDEDEDENEDDDSLEDDTDENPLNEAYGHFDPSENARELLKSDFDSEKLRAYEASKLKYYFAVLEFTSTDAADAAYKELDGLEMGHSSANMDLRVIPESDVEDVVRGRKVRDQASSIPSNYTPPDFVVAALQQTSVKCTWDEGDKDRERMLTQYGVGNETWSAMVEGDDLRAYLASDASSDEDSDVNDVNEGKKAKAASMRQLLGLDSDSDDFLQKDQTANDDDDDSFFGEGNLDDSDGDEEEGTKQMTFVPGKDLLEEKIRTKLIEKQEGVKELSPWEKYQQKRKEKKKDKKRLAKQEKAAFKAVDSDDDAEGKRGKSKKSKKKKSKKENKEDSRAPSTSEELSLLLAGDNDEEVAKDFHMRDLIRINKNETKKLKGSRKRKEDEIRTNASGLDFQLDTKDNRFAAVLDGTDSRFGIDKTDTQYKETPAMREILEEQTKRRKRRKGTKNKSEADIGDDNSDSYQSAGKDADAMQSMIRKLKSNVAKNN